MTAAIADAMRKHDPIRLSALRMLKAALMNREAERGRALDDSESQQVVASLVKQRKDSIEQFAKGGRQDLADKEAAELRVLGDIAQRYRPRDEGGHGQACGPERGRQSRQRARA